MPRPQGLGVAANTHFQRKRLGITWVTWVFLLVQRLIAQSMLGGCTITDCIQRFIEHQTGHRLHGGRQPILFEAVHHLKNVVIRHIHFKLQ